MMSKNITIKILSIVVAIVFSMNNIAFGLSTAVTSGDLSDSSDTKEDMYALGQKLFGTKRGPNVVDIYSYKSHEFHGLPITPKGVNFVKANYNNPPPRWKKNPILQKTKLIEALEYFRDKEAKIPGEVFDIREGYFEVDEAAGELPVSRIEKHADGKYVLVVHTKFVQMWNDIRKNDVWFEYDFGYGKKRTVSLAWGIFYRLAKHEMTDLKKEGLEPKGSNIGHMWAMKDGKSIHVMSEEWYANLTGGRYNILNDSMWMWFLGSYAFDNTTRYSDKIFNKRINWFFEKEGQELKLHEEFPNLFRADKAKMDQSEGMALDLNRVFAMKLARAINRRFFSRKGIFVPELTVGEVLKEEYEQRKDNVKDTYYTMGIDGRSGDDNARIELETAVKNATKEDDLEFLLRVAQGRVSEQFLPEVMRVLGNIELPQLYDSVEKISKLMNELGLVEGIEAKLDKIEQDRARIEEDRNMALREGFKKAVENITRENDLKFLLSFVETNVAQAFLQDAMRLLGNIELPRGYYSTKGIGNLLVEMGLVGGIETKLEKIKQDKIKIEEDRNMALREGFKKAVENITRENDLKLLLSFTKGTGAQAFLNNVMGLLGGVNLPRGYYSTEIGNLLVEMGLDKGIKAKLDKIEQDRAGAEEEEDKTIRSIFKIAIESITEENKLKTLLSVAKGTIKEFHFSSVRKTLGNIELPQFYHSVEGIRKLLTEMALVEGIRSKLEKIGSDRIAAKEAKEDALRDKFKETVKNINEERKLVALLSVAKGTVQEMFLPNVKSNLGNIELPRGYNTVTKIGELMREMGLDKVIEKKLKGTEEQHPLITVISEWIVQAGFDKGPGVIKLKREEIEDIYKTISLLHNDQIEIIMPERFKISLTRTMDKALDHINRRQGKKIVGYKGYSCDSDLEKLLRQTPLNIKRIVLTDDQLSLSVGMLAKKHPQLFKDKRLLKIELPPDYYGMRNKDKTVHQARVIMIAVLARLLEAGKTPMVEAVLKDLLRGHLDLDENGLDVFISELGKPEEGEVDAEKILKRVQYFLSKVVSLDEAFEKEIRLMKKFWVAA